MVVPFRAEHVSMMQIQESQAELKSEVPPEALVGDDSFTVLHEDRVIAMGGFALQWKGRWVLWSTLSPEAAKHMVRITKMVKRAISMRPPGRLEIMVQSGFEQGHRWAEVLGFRHHSHEERYLPDGGDADIYVRFV